VRDVAVDFEGGTPGKTVVSDVAFVQDDTREILVVGASTDNHIVLIDLLKNSFETRKLNVAPDVVESTGGGARHLEWAVGTDYVWVNGGEAEEAYIIYIPDGIDSAVLDRTIPNIPAGNMLFVNNYERVMMQESYNAASAAQSNSNSAAAVEKRDTMTADDDVLTIAAIVLGALGLVAGLGALLLVNHRNSAAMAVAMPATTRNTDVEQPLQEDGKSLGSKQVN